MSTDLAGLLANGSIVGIDNLVATPVIGTSAGDTLAAAATSTLVQGLGGNDSLTGGNGFDTLDGGTGTDTLIGGKGSDTYIVDSAKDVITELGVDADDRIQASITHRPQRRGLRRHRACHAHRHRRAATPPATATQPADRQCRRQQPRRRRRQRHARSAAPATTPTWSTRPTISIIENPGEGTDQVNSSASYTLGANVENLTLTGIAGISGNGNDLANKITGNAGDNFLSGNDGNDTLTGQRRQRPAGRRRRRRQHDRRHRRRHLRRRRQRRQDRRKPAPTAAPTGWPASITYTLGSNLENLALQMRPDDRRHRQQPQQRHHRQRRQQRAERAARQRHPGGRRRRRSAARRRRRRPAAGRRRRRHAGGRRRQRPLRLRRNGASTDCDLITDFTSGAGGDLIDLSDLLRFNPAISNINNFLQTVENDGSTTLRSSTATAAAPTSSTWPCSSA